MTESPSLDLRRIGDAVSYRIGDAEVTVQGKHTFGARYELRFGLSELKPEPQTFWLKNSRAPVQIGLVIAFLLTLAVSVAAVNLVPSLAVRISSLVVLALVCLAVVASLFARRVPVAVFAYKSGVEAFRIPRWGCVPTSHQHFVDTLAHRIRSTGDNR